jgi:high-affinity nickel-transport protein
MLHGIGAETATQMLVFLAAARAGGGGPGELLLVVFVLGLVTSNTVIAAVATVGYLNAARGFGIYATVAVLTGVFSLFLGALFVAGRGAVLPTILGG